MYKNKNYLKEISLCGNSVIIFLIYTVICVYTDIISKVFVIPFEIYFLLDENKDRVQLLSRSHKIIVMT